MKTKIFFLIFIAAMGITGCKQIKKLTQFNLPISKTFTLPEAPILLNGFTLPTPPIQTNYQQTFDTYNVSKDLVEEISLKNFSFTIDAPEDGDFSFLKSIDVYIMAEGLPKKKVAWKYDIPDSIGPNLTLDVDDSLDLKEYIFKDEVTLELTVTTDKTTTQDYTVTTSAIFTVDAQILGL